MYDLRGPSLLERSLKSSHDSAQIAQSSRIINEDYAPDKMMKNKASSTKPKVEGELL